MGERQRGKVGRWEIRKTVDFGNSMQIACEIPDAKACEMPDEFAPSVDANHEGEGKSKYTVYDVTLAGLIDAGFLLPGQELIMRYRPRGGDQRTYTAILGEDGSIEFMGQTYSSPSYAAIRGVNDAGSERKTVNGWTSWLIADGRTLAGIRSEFLATHESPAV